MRVQLKSKKGVEHFTTDEHPRPSSTIDNLAKLPTVFKKDGVVTAGSASGICDGAAALVIASEAAVKLHKLSPLARIVSWGMYAPSLSCLCVCCTVVLSECICGISCFCSAGVDPSIMGIGPCPAIRIALKRANLSLKDVSLVEINEAFAAQYLACEKELQLDR